MKINVIKYQISEVFRSHLNDSVLKYVTKLGHPSNIIYSRNFDGRYIATLVYNTDESNDNTIDDQENNI